MREKTISRKKIFSGNVLDLELLNVELENGSPARREIVRHHGAVGVLARRPDGQLLFVRQFRKPVDRYCLEIVAGLLETGESPQDCARREMLEETGYTIESIDKLGNIALSPGYSDERIHIFYAEVGTKKDEQSLDQNEHVELVAMTSDEFVRKLAAGEIEDGKTLAAWLLFEKRMANSHSKP